MRYDAAFRLKVVKLALKTSNVNAARHYCVNEKQFREWKKEEGLTKEMPKRSKCNQKNLPKWPKLEEDVATLVDENKQIGLTVTRGQIRICALKLAGGNKDYAKDFKVANSWLLFKLTCDD